jgi:hypothetical protein
MTILFDSLAEYGNLINIRPGRFRALASRTGVFPYFINKKVIWQLRPEEEVLDDESIQSLLDTGITIGHPDDDIDPVNTHGGVFNVEIEEEKNGILADFMIFTEKSLELAKNNTQVSPMYHTILKDTPGEYKGKKYDLVQTNIRYRSLGLVNKGRQGEEIKVFMQLSKDSLLNSEDTDIIEVPIINNRIELLDVHLEGESVKTKFKNTQQIVISDNLPDPVILNVSEVVDSVSDITETENSTEVENVSPTEATETTNADAIAEINKLGGVNIQKDYLEDVLEVAARLSNLGILSFNDAIYLGLSNLRGLIGLLLVKEGIELDEYADVFSAYKVYEVLKPLQTTNIMITPDLAENVGGVEDGSVMGDSAATRVRPNPVSLPGKVVVKPAINHPLHVKTSQVQQSQAKKVVTFDDLE